MTGAPFECNCHSLCFLVLKETKVMEEMIATATTISMIAMIEASAELNEPPEKAMIPLMVALNPPCSQPAPREKSRITGPPAEAPSQLPPASLRSASCEATAKAELERSRKLTQTALAPRKKRAGAAGRQ